MIINIDATIELYSSQSMIRMQCMLMTCYSPIDDTSLSLSLFLSFSVSLYIYQRAHKQTTIYGSFQLSN